MEVWSLELDFHKHNSRQRLLVAHALFEPEFKLLGGGFMGSYLRDYDRGD